MFNNYSASAGIFTRELGRMYWKKALTPPSFDFIDKSIYFDFKGVEGVDGSVGWFMYNFPNGPINLSLNESLEINFDIKFDLGTQDLNFFLNRQNGVRFGLFNSNNNIVNIDGFGASNIIFSNYEGYTVAIGSSGIFRLVKRSKNPGELTYSNLINTISPGPNQSGYQEILQNPRMGFNLDPNPNITYQFKEIIERISSTGLQITASITSGNNIISSGSFTDNFNTSQFDNFVFRCNQGMVNRAIINNFNIIKNLESFAPVNIEWDFNNVLTLGYDPFPSNINDRPRINTWRSDGTNLNYMSGGRYVFYPPFSPTGEIFEPWGNRNTGNQNINIPLSGNTFAGVDAFIPSGVNVTFEPPLAEIPIGIVVVDPITGRTFTTGEPIPRELSIQQAYARAIQNWFSQNNIGWRKVGTIPGEDQYQYLLKNRTNPTLRVLLNYTDLTSFWAFTSNPVGKQLSNFSVSFSSPGNSGVVIANWNDGTTPTKIISGATVSHTFQ